MPTKTYLNLPEEKRERIFQAALNEFAQRNVQEASLANIVNEAGISRGSIYQYFRNKDDIYIHVFERLRGERAQYVKPAFDLYKKEPFLIFYETFFMRETEFFLNHPQHLDIGKCCYGHAQGISRKLIQTYQNRFKEIFLLGIDYDLERGLVSREVDCAVLADLCVHLVTDIFIFQSLNNCLTINDIRKQTIATMWIIRNGVEVKH